MPQAHRDDPTATDQFGVVSLVPIPRKRHLKRSSDAETDAMRCNIKILAQSFGLSLLTIAYSGEVSALTVSDFITSNGGCNFVWGVPYHSSAYKDLADWTDSDFQELHDWVVRCAVGRRDADFMIKQAEHNIAAMKSDGEKKARERLAIRQQEVEKSKTGSGWALCKI
jgi:hypothetical protein